MKVSGEDSFWLADHHLLAVYSHGQKRKLSGVLSYKGFNPILRDSSSLPYLTLIMPHLEILSNWGLGLQHLNFWEVHKHPVHNTSFLTLLKLYLS